MRAVHSGLASADKQRNSYHNLESKTEHFRWNRASSTSTGNGGQAVFGACPRKQGQPANEINIGKCGKGTLLLEGEKIPVELISATFSQTTYLVLRINFGGPKHPTLSALISRAPPSPRTRTTVVLTLKAFVTPKKKLSSTHRSSSRASRRSPPSRPYPASATRRCCSVRLPTRKRHREVEKGIEAVANVAAAQAGNAALQLAAKHPGDVAVVPSEVQRPSSVRLILGGEPRHRLVA